MFLLRLVRKFWRLKTKMVFYGYEYNSVCIIYAHYNIIPIVYLMIGLPFSFEIKQMNNNVWLSAIAIGL